MASGARSWIDLRALSAVLEEFDVVVLHSQRAAEGGADRAVVVDDRDVGVRCGGRWSRRGFLVRVVQALVLLVGVKRLQTFSKNL